MVRLKKVSTMGGRVAMRGVDMRVTGMRWHDESWIACPISREFQNQIPSIYNCYNTSQGNIIKYITIISNKTFDANKVFVS
mmetsp:Transcript_3290/g.4768  ORF Transcript_3290/g.4768 Transcript_3290/m.4768 type:complete len:81 (-) Transcript_3290:350-592(-)